ncbi:hypothetical protein AURDEDRAFT_184288 [Auricularia subglabra TFB-10046 SS5]|nr:hypothetical protein AURDEDRAFT_184288 [Auricularia subglabra TFB-10046 SS5]
MCAHPACENIKDEAKAYAVAETFEQEGGWLPVPAGDTSTYKLDYTQVHNRTLHSGPWPHGNLTITFLGTAIYAFFVLDAGWNSDLLFYLDDASQPSGSFHRPADQASDVYLYNQLAFKSGALESGTHRLRVDVSRVPRIFFDYAIFTFDDGIVSGDSPATPPPKSSTSSPRRGTSSSQDLGTSTAVPPVRPQSGTPLDPSVAPSAGSTDTTASPTAKDGRHRPGKLGAIVGAAVAGAAGVVALLGSCVLWKRRRRADRLVPWDASAAASPQVTERSGKKAEEGTVARLHPTAAMDALAVPQHHKPGRRLPGQWFARSPESLSPGTGEQQEAQLQEETERARAEIDASRPAGIELPPPPPPPYSDGGRGDQVQERYIS